jgi:hypothetical protein
MTSIVAHSLVKNEERYIWFAVMSVIEHVDKVMIWDTGSTDDTVAIAKEIRKIFPDKVNLQTFGEVTPDEYTLLRQKMLDETGADWFMIVDGDEVWWENSITSAVNKINTQGKLLESIVTPYYNLIGDIYHYQEKAGGKYKIDGETGHLTIRFMNRKIPGLYTAKPHGQHGYFDGKDRLIQDRSAKKRIYINCPFMHFTHLVRSSGLANDLKVPKRNIKYKHELGIPFPLDFYYPESFFLPRPNLVPSPWRKAGKKYLLKAAIQTPLKMLKRRLVYGKTGY